VRKGRRKPGEDIVLSTLYCLYLNGLIDEASMPDRDKPRCLQTIHQNLKEASKNIIFFA